MSWSLSGGRQASSSAESRSTPRYSSSVVGPASFSSARGILRAPQREVTVARCWEHSSVEGAPARKKSSR